MFADQRLYTIKEVAAKTGLSTQLIRKWEERYEAVAPSRFPNGYRGYTHDDIEKLTLLKGKVDQGVPIGLAVQEYRMLDRLKPIGIQPAAEEHTIAPTEGSEADAYRKRLLDLFMHLDGAGAQRFFDRLVSLHHMEFILMQVLQPLLVYIGDLWERGEISEYQEHFASHFARERLLALRNLYPSMPGQPMIVTACAPGERHEVGVLFFGYFALQGGFRLVHLGPSPAEKGIMDCLKEFKPQAFAFSLARKEALEPVVPFFKQMDELIVTHKLHTKVFIGGRAVEGDRLMEGTQHIHLVSGEAKTALAKIWEIVRRTP